MIPFPAGRFKAIMADPPWRFRTYTGKKAVATLGPDPYPTMTRQELLDLPVGDLADKDCALFMWTVGSHIPQALELGKRWGFRYATDVFYWSKARFSQRPSPGMGYWSRKQIEPVLLFTRGSPKRLSRGVEQVIYCPRGEHSAKPELIYERIEMLVGGPYMELFGRIDRPGWTGWGAEMGKRNGSLI